jgi:hypothetical protein
MTMRRKARRRAGLSAQCPWSLEQLDYYLDELSFRYNRQRSKLRGVLFYRLIENALVTGPHPHRALVT